MAMGPRYKKMIEGMQKKNARKRKRKKKEGTWTLYILLCSNGTFYTGVTKDIDRRLKMHNDGKASKFTRTRRPVKLIYQEVCGSRVDALSREYEVKCFSRRKKEQLVEKGR